MSSPSMSNDITTLKEAINNHRTHIENLQKNISDLESFSIYIKGVAEEHHERMVIMLREIDELRGTNEQHTKDLTVPHSLKCFDTRLTDLSNRLGSLEKNFLELRCDVSEILRIVKKKSFQKRRALKKRTPKDPPNPNKKFLYTPIEELELSVRTSNILHDAGITDIGTLLAQWHSIDTIKGVGKKVYNELKGNLTNLGVVLNHD